MTKNGLCYKDTVDIYYFCKNWYETAQNTCFSRCLQFLWNKSRIPAFFFQNCRILLQFKTLGKESSVKTWPPGQWEHANPWELPRGDGEAWNCNWLTHYLALTIWFHFSLSVYIFATINLQLWALVKLENKRLSSTAVCTTFTSKKYYEVPDSTSTAALF